MIARVLAEIASHRHVYAPAGAKQAPVVVFVHGGEWTRGDKAAVNYKPKFFNQNGILFVSIYYRLTPAATHPAHVSDVAAAIRWVHDHAGEFGGDPGKDRLDGSLGRLSSGDSRGP